MNRTALERRVSISGTVRFDTAFHIGSGREGLLATDMGVLLDPFDRPILPGSTLKGLFRTTAERLAPHLDLTACLLDADLSGQPCVTDEQYRRQRHQEFMKLSTDRAKLEWLEHQTCQVCRLFGSPYHSGRIFFSDGDLIDEGLVSIQVRDGVCINRDSGTAVDGLKFDYEVASRDTAFGIRIDIENPETWELALVGAVIAEWQNGFRVGAFTSRGLGRASLQDLVVRKVDFACKSELIAYLLKREMTEAGALLPDALNQHLT